MRLSFLDPGFEEEDVGTFDPPAAQFQPIPSLLVWWMDSDDGSLAKLDQIMLGPGLAAVKRNDDSRVIRASGPEMAGQNHRSVNDHTAAFIHRVIVHGVPFRVG